MNTNEILLVSFYTYRMPSISIKQLSRTSLDLEPMPLSRMLEEFMNKVDIPNLLPRFSFRPVFPWHLINPLKLVGKVPVE